jgi:excisionase family DNA binding protein
LAPNIDKLAYKVKTFAQLCELSERFIKQEIYDGNLKAIKAGNRWRIPAEAAREYLSRREEAQKSDSSLPATV